MGRFAAFGSPPFGRERHASPFPEKERIRQGGMKTARSRKLLIMGDGRRRYHNGFVKKEGEKR